MVQYGSLSHASDAMCPNGFGFRFPENLLVALPSWKTNFIRDLPCSLGKITISHWETTPSIFVLANLKTASWQEFFYAWCWIRLNCQLPDRWLQNVQGMAQNGLATITDCNKVDPKISTTIMTFGRINYIPPYALSIFEHYLPAIDTGWTSSVFI